jgi:2-polyprenyl-6-methoxyphenol hydroxylase-like FAD-dependent oxidoreductase
MTIDTEETSKRERTAIVIGASMAGLLAARVLLNHFDRVTVIERDRLPSQPDLRRGVPQASHAHVLLARGQQILEQLFPGLEAELIDLGVPQIDWTANFPWFGIQGWMPRFQSNITSFLSSRSLLEWVVRRRLSADDRLEFLAACSVKQLLADSAQSRVVGVVLQRDHEDVATSLTADLIVDASGRSSALPKWLKALGYSAPPQTIINAFLGYSSRWYERPTDSNVDWAGVAVMANPPLERRGGLLVAAEHDRWVLSVVGIADDCPPADEQGFLDFVQSLRHPMLYETIKDAKPLSPVQSYRRTENCWRHYEKLERFPEGIVALGDAVCAFNPIYGQGMTTAALSALLLDQMLAQALQFERNKPHITDNRRSCFSRSFQKQLARLLQAPWMMATSDDFRWKTTEGGKPSPLTRFMHRYMIQIIELSTHEPAVYQTFIEVIHMIKPPAALLRPALLQKVLSHWITQGIRSTATSLGASTQPPQPFPKREGAPGFTSGVRSGGGMGFGSGSGGG